MAYRPRKADRLVDDPFAAQLMEQHSSTGSGNFGAGASGSDTTGSPYAAPPLNDVVAGIRAQVSTPSAAPASAPAAPPAGGDRAGAARTAAANNYTDIEGAGGLATGGYMGGLEGFNTQGWGSGERGSNTHKNTFGKIASRYDPKQAGAAKALMADPDFQAYFPDAKLVEHPNGDLIDFGDGKPVDVLRGAQAGGAGEAWQWGVDAGSPAGAGASGNGADIDRLIAGLSGGAQDPLAAIQAELASLTGGVDQQTLIQQMLANQQV